MQRSRIHLLVLICGLLASAGSTATAGVVFGTPVQFLVQNGPDAVAVADFDADGNADLAVVNRDVDTLSILLGNGDGSFAPQQLLPVGVEPTDVIAADFDADGNTDLAVVNDGFMLFGDPVQGSVSLLLGAGDGTFADHVEYPVGLRPQEVACGDFDEDGRLDLAVTNRDTVDVSILLGEGDGSFGPETRFALLTLNGPEVIVVGEFNSDGHLDLAVNKANGSRVRLFLGDGNGNFTFDFGKQVGDFTRSIAVGDFNEDGIDDLAVGNDGPDFPAFDGVITILRGLSNGGLFDDGNFGVGRSPTSPVVADLDGDGHQDVATVHPFDGELSVLLGDGNGEFAPELRFDVGPWPRSLAVGDFDGNTVPDLVVVLGTSSTVAVLLNSATPPNLPPVADAGPDQSVVADLSGSSLVSLDGSGSTDPNSTVGTNDDIVSFEWFTDLGAPGQTLLGTGQLLDVTFPVGTHVVSLRVEDSAGLQDDDEIVIVVQPAPVDPIPTVGEWGLILLALGMLAVGSWMFAGRGRPLGPTAAG